MTIFDAVKPAEFGTEALFLERFPLKHIPFTVIGALVAFAYVTSGAPVVGSVPIVASGLDPLGTRPIVVTV